MKLFWACNLRVFASYFNYELQIGKDLESSESWKIDLPKSNVLQVVTEDGSKISARPSGIEPKIKFYFSVQTTLNNKEEFDAKYAELESKIEAIKLDMKYNLIT